MQLQVTRDQKKGMMGMGKVVFILTARAELLPDEKSAVEKYKMGDTVLWDKELIPAVAGMSMFGAIAKKMTDKKITVNDLTRGKTIECKDIVEMVGHEETLKQACQTFKGILEIAATFGGQEVFEIVFDGGA
jgi:hypothetical protein